MMKEHEVRQAILQQYPNIPKHHIHRIYTSFQDFSRLAVVLTTYIRHNVIGYDNIPTVQNGYGIKRRMLVNRDFDSETREILHQWRGV